VSYQLDDDTRDGIVLASDIASVDPYRAATHNKGIMNGIDAVAIATGNDWRAIEAGAHAFAVRDGQYGPLATWAAGADGALTGVINIPLKVGTVGGNLDANIGAAFGLGISGVESSKELAGLMAAVGLAQNFAALRALATSGIQEGHMKLHARSVASSAGVPDELFDDVVADLVREGDIKVWRAKELVAQKKQTDVAATPDGVAGGKVILLGEHAVVYGKHALALPIQNAVSVNLRDERTDLSIPELKATIALIRNKLGIEDSPYFVHIDSRLPLAMGLGASAAYAVAIARAFNSKHDLNLDDAAINQVAFECEKLAHGTPSGVDNTIATYAEPMLFSNDGSLNVQRLPDAKTPPLVIACSHQSGRTREQVANVRERREQNQSQYDAIFTQIDELSLAGAKAMRDGNYEELGRLMNICHGLLTAIEVSTPELESMVALARAAGAVGAKMTGGGGGGSVVALCPGRTIEVRDALKSAGYFVLDLN
jgi:hydroxymethylglutaryl-CoA reductase